MFFKLLLITASVLAECVLGAAYERYLEGQFCQFNSECQSRCCSNHKCLDYNSCPILEQISRYESKNYCTLDSECASGLCCFDQKCAPQANCFFWIYLPLIGAAVFAVLTSQIVSVCLSCTLKQQEFRVREEIREPWDSKRLEFKKDRADERKKEWQEQLKIEKAAKDEADRKERLRQEELAEKERIRQEELRA